MAGFLCFIEKGYSKILKRNGAFTFFVNDELIVTETELPRPFSSCKLGSRTQHRPV